MSRQFITAVAATSIALALAGAPARADTATLTPLKDNTLFQDDTGSISNGAGIYLFCGTTGGGQIRRSLLAFDIGMAVPPGSTVTSVTLRMTMSRTRAGTQTSTLHRVLVSWGEGASDASAQEGSGAQAAPGDATWLHRFYNTTLWTAPGGDFVAAPSASVGVGGNGNYTWTSAAMAADVQAWANNPGANFGWVLRGNESSTTTAKRFNSREFTDPAQRPTLTITFTPPPGTGACCITNLPCRRLNQSDCEAAGGVFQGLSTTCFPTPCPPPTGACCLPSGACQVASQAQCAGLGGTYHGDGAPCTPGLCPVVLAHFVDPLPIPPVMQPTTGTPGGEATYTGTITEFEQRLHRDLPLTTVWGINGTYPGPTIEAASNLPVTVTWVNDLRDSGGQLRTHHYLPVDLCLHGPDYLGDGARTVMHLHGGHVPPEFDGYPESTVDPGGQYTYVYPNLQAPATLWYHDHALGITRLNVYMGIAGFYLIRDPYEQALGLPSGEFEIPLAIQDRSFNADGTLMYHAQWHEHFFGDNILVNGKVWPFLQVKRGKYRFRLLNGSGSRTYRLSLDNSATFQEIGTEQGLLPAPTPTQTITLSPGERVDIVIDFAPYPPGTQIVLTNDAPAPFPGDPGVGVIPDVLKFIVGTQTGFTAPLPASLRPVTPLLEALAVRTRDMELREWPDPMCGGMAWLINGLRWDDVVDFPRLDTIEIWRFINRSGEAHPMHIHLVQFQVLDRQAFTVINDRPVPSGARFPPAPQEAGWKDTVQAYPGELTRVIARYQTFSGRYAYHCHILEHEDNEMMRQMEVLPACPADFNADGIVNSDDFFLFLAFFFSTSPRADFNHDGVRSSQDFFDYLNAFFGGCP